MYGVKILYNLGLSEIASTNCNLLFGILSEKLNLSDFSLICSVFKALEHNLKLLLIAILRIIDRILNESLLSF